MNNKNRIKKVKRLLGLFEDNRALDDEISQMELIKSIVNKCVDEHTSIDNDEANLVEKE